MADSLSQGDIGAAAEIQAQSQPGYSGPASDPMQPSYEQRVYDDFSPTASDKKIVVVTVEAFEQIVLLTTRWCR